MSENVAEPTQVYCVPRIEVAERRKISTKGTDAQCKR